MKFKVDTETFNWMVDELPGIISNLSNSDSASLTNMFSFITDSEVVSEIKEGNYAVILDMIDNLSNDESKINLGLDLGGLGIGDDARVDIVLDSTYGDASKKVLSLSATDIAFGDYSLGLDVIKLQVSLIEKPLDLISTLVLQKKIRSILILEAKLNLIIATMLKKDLVP